jgi:hypothetical protein
MIKLKFISFFLSLLITMQMLPIAQIGNMLSKNQWTEELPHNDCEDCGKAGGLASLNHPYLPPAGYSAIVSNVSECKALAYIHFLDQIPHNHSTEVVVPPPDSVI